MQFATVLVAAAAFAVAQAVEFTNPTFATITAGEPFNLTWTEASGPVTILLKNGPPTALETVETISSGLSGNSFVWNVPATLTADTYALEIRDSSGVPNYSTQFQLIGGVGSTSSSASRTATSSGSSSSATSTGTESSTSTETESSTATTSSATRTSSSTTRSTSSPTSTPTSAPAGGMASGLTSNLALVFVAVGALFMIN